MLKVGTWAGLALLLTSHAALGAPVVDSLRPESVVEPVHYSSIYGYHCGMRNYPHTHKEECQQTREGRQSREEGSKLRRRGFGAGGRPVEN